MRKPGVVLGIFAAVVVVAAATLSYFFDAEAQRGIFSSRLEASLGRKVKLGKIRLGLFPPALQVTDSEVAEALGFPGPAFSTAKQLRARVQLIPLLRGRLEVPSVELEEPVVQLVKNAEGEWNFRTLGATAAAPAPGGGPPAPNAPTPLQIGELRIRNGRVTVTDLQKKQPPVVFDHIDLTVRNFASDKPFDWQLSLHPPGRDDSRIEAGGRGGPLNRANLAESPAEGKLKLENVDLTGLAAFTAQPALAGLFSGDAKFSSDGKTARADGSYRVERLRLSNQAGTAQAPVSGRYQVLYESAASRLSVQQFELATGKARAQTTGQLRFGPATTAELKAHVAGAPLADVGKLLPALGMKLPAGSALMEGTLNASMQVQGPVQRLFRRGLIEIRNARLANYNIAGQLGGVVRLAGVDTGGKDTAIEQFKASFVTERGYTSTKDLLLAIPGLNITGEGGFSEAGNLNFQGAGTLTRAGSAIGGLLQRVTGASNTVPFQVTGTLEHPVFRPDVGKMVSQHAEKQSGGSKLLKGLGGLFGKK